MKKNIFQTAAMLMAFAAPFALLTACDDDDDDGDDGSSYTTDGGESGTQLADIAAVYDESGVACFIETINNGYSTCTITYDSNNLIESVDGFYYDWTITYSPFKIVEVEEDDDEFTLTFGNFSFNSDGYITKVTSICEESSSYSSYSSYYYADKLTNSYSYNSDGHVSSLSVSFYAEEEYTDEDGDYTETQSGTGSAEFTWSGDKCTKVTVSSKSNGDWGTETGSYTITYTYDDDTDCKQTLYDSYCEIGLFEEEVLLCLGYYGAPGYLPATASCICEETDNYYGEKEEWYEEDDYTYSYEIDEGKVYTSKAKVSYSYTDTYDGEVEDEESGSWTDKYYYTYVGDSSSKSLSQKSLSFTEQPEETEVSTQSSRARNPFAKFRDREYRNQLRNKE